MNPKGFYFNGVSAGIKKNFILDMALIYSIMPCNYAGVFTQNSFAAAPVQICKDRLNSLIQAVIINSGNANSFTGKEGVKNAIRMTKLTEEALKLNNNKVLALSTGKIGENLPMDKIKNGIEKVSKLISKSDFKAFNKAIHTTDSSIKQVARKINLNNVSVKIYGAAKGAGMIQPNMATMLVFLTSDININKYLLQKSLNDSVRDSFNSISVDGDESTNDSVILLANGMANNSQINNSNSEDYKLFVKVLKEICIDLAKSIVKDGEGVTKLLEIQLKGAKNYIEANRCAYQIANSLLVKTAFFGEQANWGRLISAIGSCGIQVNESLLDICISGVTLIKNGKIKKIKDKLINNILKKNEIYLEINLHTGLFSKKIYSCDLSYDYIRINSEYLN